MMMVTLWARLFLSVCLYLLLPLLLSNRIQRPQLYEGGRGSDSDRWGLKTSGTRTLVNDTIAPDTEDAGLTAGEQGTMEGICGHGLFCMPVCGGWVGWAFPLREMALHRVYTAYLPVNLGRQGSTQTTSGSWPVHPRRKMPVTRAWAHTSTSTHTSPEYIP